MNDRTATEPPEDDHTSPILVSKYFYRHDKEEPDTFEPDSFVRKVIKAPPPMTERVLRLANPDLESSGAESHIKDIHALIGSAKKRR